MMCILLEKNQLDYSDSFGVNVQRRAYQTILFAISNLIHLLSYAPYILQPSILQPALYTCIQRNRIQL